MLRHKLNSVKAWLLERLRPQRRVQAVPMAVFVTIAAALVAAVFVVPACLLLAHKAFVRGHETALLVSVEPDAVIIVGDTTGPGSGIEIAALAALQQRRGIRSDVRIIMNDITVGDDGLTASTALIFNDPELAGRPVYVTYAIDQLNSDWRTVATGYLYRVVPSGDALPIVAPGLDRAFPERVSKHDIAFRGLVSLASYRYAAYLQETAGKEAALPHLLRAIDYDEREGGVTYQAYTARRQAFIDRGRKR